MVCCCECWSMWMWGWDGGENVVKLKGRRVGYHVIICLIPAMCLHKEMYIDLIY
jgi:hypothetical protein